MPKYNNDLRKKRNEAIRNRFEILKAEKDEFGSRKNTTDRIFNILVQEFYLMRGTLENIVYCEE